MSMPYRDESTARRTPKQPRPLCEALQESTDGFRQIVERLPVATALIRCADRVVLYTNPALDALLGADATRLWARNSDFLFPELADRRQINELMKRNRRVDGVEIRGRRLDGTALRLAVWQTSVVCHHTECLLAVLIDVTERYTAQQAQQDRLDVVERVLGLATHERQLIAYEIHDGFVQHAAAALMQLEAYRAGRNQGRPSNEAKLDAVADALREATAEARRLIDNVRPPDLTASGLIGALRALAHQASRFGDLSVDLSVDPRFPRLGEEAELAIYRIVQECLTNVRRHSGSSRAQVELQVCQPESALSELVITVQDWGSGFNLETTRPGCFGLAGIRARAHLCGGQVQIESAPRTGTRVAIHLPHNRQIITPAPDCAMCSHRRK